MYLDFMVGNEYPFIGGLIRKKRIADWLEKISAGLALSAFIAEKGFWWPVVLSLVFLGLALKLTDRM